MKKTYYAPEMETVELKFGNSLLAGSVPGAEGGSGDGGAGTTPGDPSQPGWGDDY